MSETCDLMGHLAAVHLLCADAARRQVRDDDSATLLAEVSALASCIQLARRDLLNGGVHGLLSHNIPAATDELDAIVTHTAEATCRILDECERLEEAAAATGCDQIVQSATKRIYEACSFQDITEQRLAKIVQTLQLVEVRVASMLRVFGRMSITAVPLTQPGLLNGPAQPHEAMDQASVDALLGTIE